MSQAPHHATRLAGRSAGGNWEIECSEGSRKPVPLLNTRLSIDAGTRRTVCFGKTRFFGRLEFAGQLGVPKLVTINKSASYGVQWNWQSAITLQCALGSGFDADSSRCLDAHFSHPGNLLRFACVFCKSPRSSQDSTVFRVLSGTDHDF